MEISFKFNNGESAQEIVAAITALFGIATSAQAAAVVAHAPAAAPAMQQTLHPHDNPAVGTDPDDAGPASTATHDAAGVPWDGRIHSQKKSMTEKGLWRKLKGVQETTINSVMSELAAKGLIVHTGTPVPPAQPAAPASPAAPAAPPAAAVAPVPPMPAAAIPAAPPLPPAQPVETPFTKFVNFVASNLHSAANPGGRITDQWVSDALKSLQVVDAAGNGSVQALQHADEAKIKSVHNTFAQALGVPGV